MIQPSVTDTSSIVFAHFDQNTIHAGKDSQGFQLPVCDCIMFGRKMWCQHIEKYTEECTDLEWAKLQVVIYKEPWLTIRCTVLKQGEFREVRVLWGRVTAPNAGQIQAEGSEVIGYISDGELFRMEIRRMVLDWLPGIPYAYPQKMKCQDTAHTDGDSTFDISGGNPDWGRETRQRHTNIDAFDLLDTGRCRRCNTLVPAV